MQGNSQTSVALTWQRAYRGATIEHALLRSTGRGRHIDGALIGAIGDSPVGAKYSVFMDELWNVRSCIVEAEHHGALRRRILTHRGNSWFLDGSPEPALEGCDVLDLGFTPSTNTIAINRLSMPVGEQREVAAAYLDFPSMNVSRSRQAYVRKDSALYEYRNLDSGFTAEVEVDAENVVVEYGPVWRRLAAVKAENDVLADARVHQFCRVLASAGPSPELGGREADFDWLVGGWSAEVRDYSSDGVVAVGRGEWWFTWILEGRAMQDVWMVPPPSERHGAARLNNRYGTTTRRFDMRDGRWYIAWINPASGMHNELSGNRVHDRIILEGTSDGMPIRWSFSDITPTSFRWTGQSKTPDGTWRLDAEFTLERLA